MDDLQRLLSASTDDAGDAPAPPSGATPETPAAPGDGGLGRMLGGGAPPAADEPAATRRPSRSAAAVSASLLGGAVVLGGMYWRAGPATASASIDPVAEKTVGAFLKDGAASALRAATDQAEAVAARFRSYPNAAQVDPDDLRTNPFRAGGPTAEAAGSATLHPAWSPARQADADAALAAVRSLSLQSVVHGSGRGACLIDGKFYREGDAVAVAPPADVEVVVESVSADGVVLRAGGSRYALSMAR